MRDFLFVLIFLMPCPFLMGQGLFENAISETAEKDKNVLKFGLNGYVRSTLFAGESAMKDGCWLQSAFGETSLTLQADKSGTGSAYTELRFRGGYEYGRDTLQLDVREAYIDLYPGNMTISLGKKIIVWGRADGLNPTNNITPQNYFVRSPEPDDYRLGNILLQSTVPLSSRIRLECIWVPWFQPSIYRFDLFDMPDFIHLTTGNYPTGKLKNGSIAGKINFETHGLDGSVSYFNGYDPLPGINPGTVIIDSAGAYLSLSPTAFRQQTWGIDFATTTRRLGLRGEFALRITEDGYKEKTHVPNPDLQYVLGMDRTIGKFSLIVQYLGRYTFDFEPLPTMDGIPVSNGAMDALPPIPPAMLEEYFQYQFEKFNRAIFYQQVEWNHTLSVRPGLTLLYETLQLEIFALYYIKTREYSILPRISYSIADGLKMVAGGQYYRGPEDTNFDLLGPVLNGGYLELKYMF
jgi:hypothetical protein